MFINWKIHRRRRLIFAFVGLLFGIWFVQNAIAKCGIALLIHDNPPGTPLSKAKAYVASRGWYQVVFPNYYDHTPEFNVDIYGSMLPWLLSQDKFIVRFKIDSHEHLGSVTVDAFGDGL